MDRVFTGLNDMCWDDVNEVVAENKAREQTESSKSSQTRAVLLSRNEFSKKRTRPALKDDTQVGHEPDLLRRLPGHA
jgi:hypothetical protein